MQARADDVASAKIAAQKRKSAALANEEGRKLARASDAERGGAEVRVEDGLLHAPHSFT